jgi:hypothetical protein
MPDNSVDTEKQRYTSALEFISVRFRMTGSLDAQKSGPDHLFKHLEGIKNQYFKEAL